MKRSQLLIAGGGIGGLAAALAGARAGWGVRLFERAWAFTEVGAGIQIGPNVTRVLQGWGLGDALASVAAFPPQLVVRSAKSGAELGALQLGQRAVQRYGAPYATLHRADLHQMLLNEVQKQAGVALHLNTSIQSYDESPQAIKLHMLEGKPVRGDALIGADGLWSRVRQQMLGDELPRATRHVAYRAMLSQQTLPAHLRSMNITAWLGPRLHVVQYPVRGGEWLNLVVIVQGQALTDLQEWDHQGNAQDLQAIMASTCSSLRELMAAVPQWRKWALCDRAPMRGAHEHARGRVALLGDAAHPMRPYLAQGAGMAIEDAAALGQILGQALAQNTLPVLEALQRFATARWQRNAQVQARAIRNGKIFHLSGPAAWSRNAAMRLLGERVLDVPWLYGGP